MLPRPTADPVAARMKARREDHMPWIEVLCMVEMSPEDERHKRVIVRQVPVSFNYDGGERNVTGRPECRRSEWPARSTGWKNAGGRGQAGSSRSDPAARTGSSASARGGGR